MRSSTYVRATSLAAALMMTVAGAALAADDVRPSSPAAGAASSMQTPSQVDAQKLIGQKVKNPADETIGDIDSVILDKDGKAVAVIVGVGGFLGMGERSVALGWNQLNITDNGRNVHANLTKEQLRAMPEYKFADASNRSKAFFDPNYRLEPMGSNGVNRPSDTTRPSDRR